MISLLKNHRIVVFQTRCFSKGTVLRRYYASKQCRPITYALAKSPLLFQNKEERRLSIAPVWKPRSFHMGTTLRTENPLKPSSRVEETVTALKEKAKEEKATRELPVQPPVQVVVKKSLIQRAKDELIHYYHGFRVLFMDINVSRKLLWRVLKGYQLTRREHKLLIRTVGDVFRLLPFSIFIIVPFLEFALPLVLKFFPNMLPSTFQSASVQEDKIKKNLKVKLEMAKFLQRTLDDMSVFSNQGHSSQLAKEFGQFFEKVRTSGEMVKSDDIMKFSKLFEDEITLDSLPRPQLMALCRVLDMNPIGTTNFLRYQLRLKLRSLGADDVMIQKEGVDALSQAELQAACRARGMRALGVSEERLKAQLNQWLDLSLTKKVPPSLLLLSQAFMLPDSTPTEEKLAATIQSLPDVVGTATKAVIGEREGKVDYKTKLEVIKEEVAMIKEERKEEQKAKEEEQRKEDLLVDSAPILTDKAKSIDPVLREVVDSIKKTTISEKLANEDVTNKEMEALESALETLGKDRKKLLVEKEELQELREEMAEYQEDIADLQKITTASGQESEVQETVAAKRLFRKVNKMISKMESALQNLETTDEKIKTEEKSEQPPAKMNELVSRPVITGLNWHGVPREICIEATRLLRVSSEEMLRIDDLISTLRKIQGVQDSSLEKIADVLSKMDADRDGVVRVDVLLKMLELVGNEQVKLNKKQVDELIELIDKEEMIEMDESLHRALKKEQDEKEEELRRDEETVKSSNSSNKVAMAASAPTQNSNSKIAKSDVSSPKNIR